MCARSMRKPPFFTCTAPDVTSCPCVSVLCTAVIWLPLVPGEGRRMVFLGRLGYRTARDSHLQGKCFSNSVYCDVDGVRCGEGWLSGGLCYHIL